MQQPRTRYAKSDGVSVAYQVVGDGPFDLVFVPGFISHLDLQWGDPAVASFLKRLASFSRLIVFDKRGTGLSDPVSEVPTLEKRMDDVRAIMDAAGSERAALFGFSEGGPMSILFSATYPERTEALVLYGTYARGTGDPGHPWGPSSAAWAKVRQGLEPWGEGRTLQILAPSIAGGELQRRLRGLYERAAASPAMARALIDAVAQMDVTHVLPMIRVRTLVIHRSEDFIPVEGGRYIAEEIKGARYVELPGPDHLPWVGDAEAILDEVEEFLTGARHGPEPDRMLATVLFTDVVGSTERAAALGDRRWRELLDAHHALVRGELERFRGREINTAGDSFLATFDGPTRAIRCAEAIAEEVRTLGIEIRAGLHTGECELSGEQVRGLALHVGARIAAQAGPGEILISSTVRDLVVGSGIEFADRGIHALKGVPGEWRLFAVARPRPGTEAGSPDMARGLGLVDRALMSFVRRAPALARRLVALTRPS